MYVLIPHISCVVNEQEFPEALQAYQDIYVITGLGKILRHIKLKGNRHIRIEVKEIPGIKPEEMMPQVREEINFLPNGKIPAHLLDEIVQFFKEVMNVKKAEQEAMAHVLWNDKDKDNEDKGYRIAIPNQTVSKASVRYEHDHIEKGDIIALDIHSHNSMGAFFSGTDDSDDKKGIFFSGVAGHLNSREPEFKWRLNVNETKIQAEVEDIFDIPKKEVRVPTEWLEKVSTNDFSGGYRSSTFTQESPGVYNSGKRQPPAWQKHTGSGSNSSANSKSEKQSWRPGGDSSNSDEHFPDYGFEGDFAWRRGVEDLYPANEAAESTSSSPLSGTSNEETGPKLVPQLPAPRIVRPGSMTAGEINSENKRGGRILVEEVDTLPLAAGEYAANTINYGKDAAEAYEQMTAWIGSIEGMDELLLNIMSLAYGMLTSKGQEKLATKGF